MRRSRRQGVGMRCSRGQCQDGVGMRRSGRQGVGGNAPEDHPERGAVGHTVSGGDELAGVRGVCVSKKVMLSCYHYV